MHEEPVRRGFVLQPCSVWESRMAALYSEDPESEEGAALREHIEACPACASFQLEMDRLLLAALMPERFVPFERANLPARIPGWAGAGYARKDQRFTTSLQGRQLGHYHLMNPLGKGGYAEVWLGRHIHLDTPAAVKILYQQTVDFDEFKREAVTIRGLTHPNIIKIHDFGLDQETPYLIMEYAPYGTLKQRHPLGQIIPLPTIIPYVEQLSDALQYAHNHQVIHRDVKPENMLLGQQNQILLSDFGIATETPSLRHPNRHDIAGTLRYMAPEQRYGDPVRQSDQYSLAVVVYEWLTGSHPMVGGRMRKPSMALSGTDSHPISPDVEYVVMRALTSDPRDRFENISDFADALKQATLTQVGFPTFHLPRHTTGETLCTYREHTDWIYAVIWLPDGQRIVSAGNDRSIQSWDAANGSYVVRYNEHARRVTGLTSSPDGKYICSSSQDGTLMIREIASGGVRVLRGHRKEVNTVSWSPDGSKVISGGNDQTLRIWDASTGQQILNYQGHKKEVNAVSWSPDGRMVASASNDRTVQIWDAHTGSRHLLYERHRGWVLAVAWSPDGRHLLSAGNDQIVRVWNAATGERVRESIRHPRPITSVVWSPDGRRVAFGSLREVAVWDISTGSYAFTYHGHTSWVRSLAWSPDGKKIASAGDDKTVRVWSIA